MVLMGVMGGWRGCGEEGEEEEGKGGGRVNYTKQYFCRALPNPLCKVQFYISVSFKDVDNGREELESIYKTNKKNKGFCVQSETCHSEVVTR